MQQSRITYQVCFLFPQHYSSMDGKVFFFLAFLMRFYCILKNWNGSRANHEEEKSIVYDGCCGPTITMRNRGFCINVGLCINGYRNDTSQKSVNRSLFLLLFSPPEFWWGNDHWAAVIRGQKCPKGTWVTNMRNDRKGQTHDLPTLHHFKCCILADL